MHLTEFEIAKYIDGKLSSGEIIRIEKHLADCLECTESISLVYKLNKSELYPGKYSSEYEKKALAITTGEARSNFLSFFGKRKMQYSFAGISVLILISISLIFIFQENENITKKEVTSQSETSLEQKKIDESISKKVITRTADMYAVNSELEFLVNQNYRDGGIRIMAPAVGEKLMNKVRFNWETKHLGTLYLIIMNNRNENVYKEQIDGNEFILPKELSPALYYWKLETDEELLYIGKFSIIN